eukprot:CAMPEP_0170454144 /NCGR_PEP_ID=MMETSP0123-20130129/2495_1 /TAXON_ID=182087 /ORGANISM="Favella ehrenbergii, Strain Fehren 1" /LENGTH=57 /DNA_ID=CAMNT_0010716761 /DNA_START=290 /DNA_END=463 /DNA_ORIENTATION=-
MSRPKSLGQVVASKLASVAGYLAKHCRNESLHESSKETFLEPNALEAVNGASVVGIR